MGLASKIRIEIEGTELKDFLDLTIRQSIYSHHEFEITCRMDAFEKRMNLLWSNPRRLSDP